MVNRKAFDRVKHAKIIECMENLDIDGKDISLISNLYWNQKAYMRTEEGLSLEIQIMRVRQGCVITLSVESVNRNIVGAINTNKGIQRSLVEEQSRICATLMILFYWLKQRKICKKY